MSNQLIAQSFFTTDYGMRKSKTNWIGHFHLAAIIACWTLIHWIHVYSSSYIPSCKGLDSSECTTDYTFICVFVVFVYTHTHNERALSDPKRQCLPARVYNSCIQKKCCFILPLSKRSISSATWPSDISSYKRTFFFIYFPWPLLRQNPKPLIW